MDDIKSRLRDNSALVVCPFDKRSPDYYTTPNDKPCKFCGSEPEGPDKCTGADLRIMSEAAAYIERLEAALDTSLQAVMDWVSLYAPDECSEESVSAAKERIREAGGTLGYLADVLGVIRDASHTLKGGDNGK